jgi:hypothetical protein
MQVIGFILSLLSFMALGLTVLPLLGALNWLNIPFAGLGLVFSIIGVAVARGSRRLGIAGIVLSLIAILVGMLRLFLGGGLF